MKYGKMKGYGSESAGKAWAEKARQGNLPKGAAPNIPMGTGGNVKTGKHG